MIKIIDLVSKYLSIELFFVKQRSVASITAGLQKTVKDLEAHASAMTEKAAEKALEAVKALKEREEHVQERAAAVKIAANIQSLLS